MIGQKFNRLTVIQDLGKQSTSTRTRHFVLCRCSCGKIKRIRLDGLKTGYAQSCGCLNRERVGAKARGRDRSKVKAGDKYGKLTMLERLKTKPGVAWFLCQCACGRDYKARGCALSGGTTIECRKCAFAEHLIFVHEQNKKPAGEANAYAAFLNNKQGAEKRNLVWDLSFDQFKNFSGQCCGYCGAAPENVSHDDRRNGDFVYNGIDRINNVVGYTADNSLACCWPCNLAKGERPVADFLEWVTRVKERRINNSSPLVLSNLKSDWPVATGRGGIKLGLGQAAFQTLIRSYKSAAKSRNLAFSLTEAELYALFKSPCFYCGVESSNRAYHPKLNGDFVYTGIDRTDNSTGYTIKNVVPCCYICNKAKWTFSQNDFLAHIKRIWEHNAASYLIKT